MKSITVLFSCFLVYSLHAIQIDELSDSKERLEQLKIQIDRELKILSYPNNDWVVSKQRTDKTKIYDVVVIGGGQTGITTAFALKKKLIENVLIIDENKVGNEGPWTTYAMTSGLRTPKYLTGPDCEVPSLTCQSWFEAKYGCESWDEIKKIPVNV